MLISSPYPKVCLLTNWVTTQHEPIRNKGQKNKKLIHYNRNRLYCLMCPGRHDGQPQGRHLDQYGPLSQTETLSPVRHDHVQEIVQLESVVHLDQMSTLKMQLSLDLLETSEILTYATQTSQRITCQSNGLTCLTGDKTTTVLRRICLENQRNMPHTTDVNGHTKPWIK